MKLFHTADVHLDRCFAGCRVPPAAANWRRQHLREIFMELLRRAASEKAAALLIAGDLFEAQRVTRDTVAFLREAFDLARPVPVFIAPGNADPSSDASPYATETWPDNVHIFRSPQWEAVRVTEHNLVVHGAACVAGGPTGPDFKALQPPDDGSIHVGVAHACWGEAGDGTVTPEPILASGLAYLALGHVHTAGEAVRAGRAVGYYSGAPEMLGYGQGGTPGYLEVFLGGQVPAIEAQVKSIATDFTRFLEHVIDCGELKNEAQAVEAITGIGRAQDRDCIARITLVGRRPSTGRWSLQRLAAEAGKTFVHLEVIDETTSEAAALTTPGPGSLGLFMERMRRDIGDTADAERKAMLRRAEALGAQAYQGFLTGNSTS